MGTELDVHLLTLCRHSPIGKHLPDALYVHQSALSALASELQAYEAQARQLAPQGTNATLIKFSFQKPQISYLFYPDFDHHPHPALHHSVQVNLETKTVAERHYSTVDNPPILHRKETFVTSAYPLYAQFQWLTQQEEALGLLDNARSIGFRQNWEQRLSDRRLMIYHHQLACPLPLTASINSPTKPQIHRHKAAIARVTASKPVRLAIEAGLFEPGTTYFDYGCGRGVDVDYMNRLGYVSAGWDPYFCPDTEPVAADIVNLGYVINVIEETAERRHALLQAWHLTQKVLIVSAQVLISDRSHGVVVYGDGIITRRNTFQKYYAQEELKIYIDQVLNVDAIPVALGIYFVFRDSAQAETFRATRFRSKARSPHIRLNVSQFEQYHDLLQPLIAFYTERGRLPSGDEIDTSGCRAIQNRLGSIKRAFNIVLKATERQDWDYIEEKRRQDLLVYLALSQFGRRPTSQQLSPTVQRDIKALLGTYHQACTTADLMLMSLGNLAIIEERCRQSSIGQQRPHSLWVHVSALDALDPLLRLYEGCASRTIGRPQDASIVKFHVNTPKITYLFLPNFDIDPHPALSTSMQISLRDLKVRYRDYDLHDNPPILHRKEQVVMQDYPGYEKFAKLSQQEYNWGLLDDITAIGNRHNWERCLEDHCATLKGHRLIWRKDADAYHIKVVRSRIRSRSKR